MNFISLFIGSGAFHSEVIGRIYTNTECIPFWNESWELLFSKV